MGRRPQLLVVGLDVGTTSSKAVVYDEHGTAVATGRAPTTWTPTPFGAELDPRTLLGAAATALARALDGAPAGEVAGIGVTSMGESGVLLDGSGDPVAPVVAWHDTRDEAELASLAEAVGERRFSERTGLPFRHQWSLTKHRRLLDHDEGARRAVRRLNVAEWVVRGLGGQEGASSRWPPAPAGSTSPPGPGGGGPRWSGADVGLMPRCRGWHGAPASGRRARPGAGRGRGPHRRRPRRPGGGRGSWGGGRPGPARSCGTAEALVRMVAPGSCRSGWSRSPRPASPSAGTPCPGAGACSGPRPAAGPAARGCRARTGRAGPAGPDGPRRLRPRSRGSRRAATGVGDRDPRRRLAARCGRPRSRRPATTPPGSTRR